MEYHHRVDKGTPGNYDRGPEEKEVIAQAFKMSKTKHKPWCLHCHPPGAVRRRAWSRGVCAACYHSLRRAIQAGKLTEAQTVEQGLWLAPAASENQAGVTDKIRAVTKR